jgi:hypothetical protein
MAGGEGFEPSTPNLGGWCSIRTELLALGYQPLRGTISPKYQSVRRTNSRYTNASLAFREERQKPTHN